MKPASLAAAILLSLVAIAHLLRLAFGVEMTVGGTVIPMWLSVVGVVVPLGVAILLWREREVR